MASSRRGRSAGDKYALSYTVWTCAVCLWVSLGNELDRVFSLYVALIPVLAIPVIGLVLALIISLGRSIYRFCWRRAISILAAPLIAASVFALLIRLDITPQLVRFEIWKAYYVAQVSQLETVNGGPRLKIWPWGSVGGVAVPNIDYFLVYDDSDQLILPAPRRSSAWRTSAEAAARDTGFYAVLHPEAYTTDTKSYGRNVVVRNLSGHFYYVADDWSD